MRLSLICAASRNNVIGHQNRLPWHLPADLAYFKRVTHGNPVIMGRKTHESIGRALPGRRNIVLSRNPEYETEGCEVVKDLNEALNLCSNESEVFVIGGAHVYESALPYAQRIYLTRVACDVEGDTFLFEIDPKQWREVESESHPADAKNAYDYRFSIWERC